MYHIVWRACYIAARRVTGASARISSTAGGIGHPTLKGSCSKGNTLGLHLGHLGAPLHTCSVQSRAWQRQRPLLSSLLSHPATRQQQQNHHHQQQQQQHGHLLSLSPVAGFSSASFASELSAAIAAAPTAAALQSLAAAAASTPQQAWLVEQYKVQLIPRLEEASPLSLIKALLFLSKLGPGHAEVFERAVPVLYNQLGQLTPADLLDLLSAYATAAAHTPSAYSHELFAALTEFLWEGLDKLDPAGLADIAACYAAVDHFDDDEDFFTGVAAAALHKLEAFCPDDLSRLLLGLAQLRFAAPELSAAALAQLSAQLEAWPLSCMGKALHALALVQAPADPCVLERVANHVSNTLRNLRTSTDGKQLLASLSQTATSSSSSNGEAATVGAGSAGGVGLGSGTLPGLQATGSNTRLGPTWQGFGASRSTSTDTSSSSSSSAAAPVSAGAAAAVPSTGGSSSSKALDGAASIWAAANSSSSLFEYAGEQSGQPPPGVTHVLGQECELGPDYITVTSYSPDGHITTTYIKKAAAGSSLGLDSIGRAAAAAPSSHTGEAGISGSSSSSSSGGFGGAAGVGGVDGYGSTRDQGNAASSSSSSVAISSSSSNGVMAPAGTRAMATSSGRGWRPLGSSNSGSSGLPGSNGGGVEGCPASWQWQTISSDCRPVYDDAPALQGALVDVVWAFAMLGHVHSTMAKECFKALALVAPEALSDTQLVMLWGAHMRYQQLGHVVLDPNPLLAESYSVFAREVSRAAPRTLSLPASLQPLAAGGWLLESMRQSPEYQQQQQQQQEQQQQEQAALMSWKYRDPTVLTLQGLEASVRQALVALGLPVGSPCVTLDGLERVGLPLKHNGVCIAWQVLPPAVCTRNAPHSPTVTAQAHRWALQYRGYTVLQVPFHEWASVLESGDSLVAAGYLQHLLDGVTSVRAPHVPNF